MFRLIAFFKSRMLDTNKAFEALVRPFLAEHPELRYEWRPVDSFVDGGRTDLICAPGDPNEVFATLRSYQITIGTKQDDKDFESWGRSMSDADVAQEAFDYFVELLTKAGIVA